MEEETYTLQSTADTYTFDRTTDALTEALDKINPNSNEFRSTGENVGWQNKSGTTTVTLTSGEDLIRKLTPRSRWNLEAKVRENEIVLSLSHHDSPTGETHTLRPN